MHFSFPHSHAFQRGRVAIDDEANAAPECAIEFGDGVTLVGEWKPSGDTIALAVPAYRTAKGTRIDTKTWMLVKGSDGVWRSERTGTAPE